MTDKQKQNLLAYLGYYVGEIDGKFGTRSKTATKAFQKDFGITADGICGAETEKALKTAVSQGMPGLDWEQIRYFTRAEFRCTCGGRGCNGFPAEPNGQLVRNADAARAHFGRIARVSSGVRCALRNSELPGSAANSLHLRGKAMDFRVEGVSAGKLLAFVKELPGVDEAYAIDENYVHMGVEKT